MTLDRAGEYRIHLQVTQVWDDPVTGESGVVAEALATVTAERW